MPRSLATFKIIVTALFFSKMALISSCSPYSANSTSPTGLKNEYTGGKVLVSDPYLPRPIPEQKSIQRPHSPKKVVVDYVSSVEPQVFEKIKNNLNQIESHLRTKAQSQIASKIQDARINYFLDTNFLQPTLDVTKATHVELTIKTNNFFHIFRSSVKKLNSLKGKKTTQLKNYSYEKLEASPWTVSIACQISTVCENINIRILAKNENNPNQMLQAFLGYSQRAVKIEILAEEQDNEQIKNLDFFTTLKKSQNQNGPYTASSNSWTVGDGISTTRVYQSGVLNIFTKITDSKKSAAAIAPNHTKLNGVQVMNGAFIGTTDGRSLLFQLGIKSSKYPDKKLGLQIKVLSQQENQKHQKQKIDRQKISDKINNENIEWADVGVNLTTSLFYYGDLSHISPEDKRNIFKMEAELDSYRNHPAVLNYSASSKHQEDLKTFCSGFIENMAPAREIIANTYQTAGVSPSFAATLWIESFYGKYNYNVDINKSCASAAGTHQINDSAFLTIDRDNYGLVGRLKQQGIQFVRYFAKKHFPSSRFSKPTNRTTEQHKALCEVENPDMRNPVQGDDRMYLESASLISASYIDYIYKKQKVKDAALSFTNYYLGPNRLARLKGSYNKVISAMSLREIIDFNLSRSVINSPGPANLSNPETTKANLKYDQQTIASGVDYAIRSLAIRNAMTQPELACQDYYQSENEIISIYEEARQKIKSETVRQEMSVFRPNDKPILNSNLKFIQ